MSLACQYARECDKCQAQTPLFPTSAGARRYAKKAGWRRWTRYHKAEVCTACITAGRVPAQEVGES